MDLSSFGEARVSELMSRFTYDVDSINQGIQTVIGRAIREPLEDGRLPGRAPPGFAGGCCWCRC